MTRLKTIKSRLFPIRVLLTVLLVPVAVAAWSDDGQIWKALKTEGHIGLLRHALAPGTGDPKEFQLDDCSTQRNLSDLGRAQATQIGDRFRENGVAAAKVYSSQWCRCMDTANLLNLGAVRQLEIINSFFQNFEHREKQTVALENWIRAQMLNTPIVLITHQVNITALTGKFAASGELIVIKVPEQGPIEVVGTLENTLKES